jgi:ApaG protein
MARREMETKIIEYSRYVATTHNIKISVAPAFHPEQSDPNRNIYMFTYTVMIENLGEHTAQLINRHWIVYSGEKKCADVKGEGVIGDQPILMPGESYRYTSGTSITEPVGMMWGSYTFQNENGDFFDVEIPKFDLMCGGLPEGLLN